MKKIAGCSQDPSATNKLSKQLSSCPLISFLEVSRGILVQRSRPFSFTILVGGEEGHTLSFLPAHQYEIF